MACAVFDNPVSMRREIWQDKIMVESYSLEVLYMDLDPAFMPGHIEGDTEAIPAELLK